VHCKQFQYACQHCASSRCHVLAVRIASFQVPSAAEGKRGGKWAWQLLSTLRRQMQYIRKWSLSCVCRSCETDAVRRPAARPFVRDAQSAMRLPDSGSRLCLDPLSGSRMSLWASWTKSLTAGWRTASVSQLRQTDDLLPHTLHLPPCLTCT